MACAGSDSPTCRRRRRRPPPGARPSRSRRSWPRRSRLGVGDPERELGLVGGGREDEHLRAVDLLAEGLAEEGASIGSGVTTSSFTPSALPLGVGKPAGGRAAASSSRSGAHRGPSPCAGGSTRGSRCARRRRRALRDPVGLVVRVQRAQPADQQPGGVHPRRAAPVRYALKPGRKDGSSIETLGTPKRAGMRRGLSRCSSPGARGSRAGSAPARAAPATTTWRPRPASGAAGEVEEQPAAFVPAVPASIWCCRTAPGTAPGTSTSGSRVRSHPGRDVRRAPVSGDRLIARVNGGACRGRRLPQDERGSARGRAWRAHLRRCGAVRSAPRRQGHLRERVRRGRGG